MGYTDSDYAGCIDSRHSTSGYLFTLRDGLISWSSKHQPIVTTSTCEAEYVASCHATKEAVWLQNLLDLLGHTQPTTVIYSNNAGSMSLMRDATFHGRLKHINIQFHYTQDQMNTKDVTFKYLPTADMPADMLTKALPCPKHEKFTSLFGILEHCDNTLLQQ